MDAMVRSQRRKDKESVSQPSVREKAVTRDDLAKQVNVPLPLSLYAQLVVADVKPAGGAAMPASHFAVPDEYEEMDLAQDVQRLLRPGRVGGR